MDPQVLLSHPKSFKGVSVLDALWGSRLTPQLADYFSTEWFTVPSKETSTSHSQSVLCEPAWNTLSRQKGHFEMFLP